MPYISDRVRQDNCLVMQFCRYRVLRVDRIGFFSILKALRDAFPRHIGRQYALQRCESVIQSRAVAVHNKWNLLMYRRPFLSITNLIARDELVVLCEMCMTVRAWLYCIPLILDRCQNCGLVFLLWNYDGGTQHAIQYGMMISRRVLISVYSWYLIFVTSICQTNIQEIDNSKVGIWIYSPWCQAMSAQMWRWLLEMGGKMEAML